MGTRSPESILASWKNVCALPALRIRTLYVKRFACGRHGGRPRAARLGGLLRLGCGWSHLRRLELGGVGAPDSLAATAARRFCPQPVGAKAGLRECLRRNMNRYLRRLRGFLSSTIGGSGSNPRDQRNGAMSVVALLVQCEFLVTERKGHSRRYVSCAQAFVGKRREGADTQEHSGRIAMYVAYRDDERRARRRWPPRRVSTNSWTSATVCRRSETTILSS